MKKIGTYTVDDEVMEVFEDNNKFFLGLDDKKRPLTKLMLADLISMAWSEDSIYDYIEEKNGTYTIYREIPIYDWIILELQFSSNNEETAKTLLNDFYNDMIKYHEIYEKNVEKNKRDFMLKIHKFAYFNDEIHYFEDSDKSFRELVVECGIPNDARADEPIFGWVFENNLVIYKLGFLKGEKEIFLKWIEDNFKNIAIHYGLSKFKLFRGINYHFEKYVDENDNIIDELISMDFDYYTPRLFVCECEI